MNTILQHVPLKQEHCEQNNEESDYEPPHVQRNMYESCGSVLILNRSKLFILCNLCETKYLNLEQFALHLNKSHCLFTCDAVAPSRVTSSEEKDIITYANLSAVKLEPRSNLNNVENNNDENAPPMVEIALSETTTNHDYSDVDQSSSSSDDHSSGNNVLKESKQSNGRIVEMRSSISPLEETLKKEKPSPPILETLVNTNANEGVTENECDEDEECDSIDINIDATSKTDKNKPIYCEFCNKLFFKNSRLQDHMRVHTGEKPFKCEICQKSFRLNMRLKDHMRRHNDKKEYGCNICELRVNCKQDLILHQRHHDGDKRYKCEFCDKPFVRSTDLKIHIRIHTNEKPYKCEICGMSFRANQNLIVHKVKHTKEKHFKCDYCDKRFYRNVDRKVHHRTHTGEKPFKCHICEKQYSAKVHVRAHIERQHGDVQLDPSKTKKRNHKTSILKDDIKSMLVSLSAIKEEMPGKSSASTSEQIKLLHHQD